MADPLFQFLDAVNIDDDRQYIEFQFRDCAGEPKVIQIDFAYVESLAAVFQQAFLSATLADRQGSNRSLGPDWIAVPRADVDHPVSVGVDDMSGKIVAMFLVGSPFQICYALPRENARILSQDLLAASEEIAADGRGPINWSLAQRGVSGSRLPARCGRRGGWQTRIAFITACSTIPPW